MRRWELVFGVVFLLACDGCASLVRKIRKFCFL